VNHLGPTCVPITRAATNRDESSATRKPMLAADRRAADQTSRSSRNSKRFETRFAPATERDARRFVVFPSRSPLRPRTITRAALAGGDPEGGGGGGGEARGTASFHCLRSGARAPPPTHPGHTIRYPWPLYIPARRLTRGLFFSFSSFFFSPRRGPPLLLLTPLGRFVGRSRRRRERGGLFSPLKEASASSSSSSSSSPLTRQ